MRRASNLGYDFWIKRETGEHDHRAWEFRVAGAMFLALSGLMAYVLSR